MSVGILRLQSGLDFSNLQDEAQTTDNFPRNQSYSAMSQGTLDLFQFHHLLKNSRY